LFAKWVCERYSFSLDKVTRIQEETMDYFSNEKIFDQRLNLKGGTFKNCIVYNSDAMIVFTQRIIESDLEKVDTFFELFTKDVETQFFTEKYKTKLLKHKETFDTLFTNGTSHYPVLLLRIGQTDQISKRSSIRIKTSNINKN
jgi:hypothetical protein